jgi:predicted small secreted protein
MKKIVLTLLLFVTASTLLVSCDEDTTAGVSRVTNYPLIEVLGDDVIYIQEGTTFNDPGAIATEGGAEIPFVVSAEGLYRGGTTLDTNVGDVYIVKYTATNTDGFSISGIRTVVVYPPTGDLVTSIEGVYVSTVRRNGSLLNPAQGSSVNMEYVYIWKNTDGTYAVSDALGGWYDLGRHLGHTSATKGGVINAVSIPANTFTFPGGVGHLENEYFGGAAELTSLNVNPVTKTLILGSHWLAPPATNYNFESTLVQVQL